MFEIGDYLKRNAERCNFTRSFYVEKNMPTHPSNCVVFPFFGDVASLAFLSSFLLKIYKEANPDKYLILCSWPGFQDLFPYVDEYWFPSDKSLVGTLAYNANDYYNNSDEAVEMVQKLNEVFSNVLTYQRDFRKYYDYGFTKNYWETFEKVNRYLPEVLSSSKVSSYFISQLNSKVGKKLIVYPVKKVRTWHRGETIRMPLNILFWKSLMQRLLDEGYVPVVYQDFFTYDMSPEFSDRCIYLVHNRIQDIMAVMNHIGCVLDVYSGISRLSILSRTPFVCVDERARYFGKRDFEMDDLNSEIIKKYLFSFSTMLQTGTEEDWKRSIVDNIIVSLNKIWNFVEDKSNRPSMNESYEKLNFSSVREKQNKRLGVKFITLK